MLFSKEEIEVEFEALNISYLNQMVVPLVEDQYHDGTASVIKFLAIKGKLIKPNIMSGV